MQEQLHRREKKVDLDKLAALFALITAPVTIFPPLYNAIISDRFWSVGFYSLFLFLLLAISTKFLFKKRIDCNLSTNQFAITNGVLLPRYPEYKKLKESVIKSEKLPIFLVGVSGVGKSHLVGKYISDISKERVSYRPILINRYASTSSFINSIQEKIIDVFDAPLDHNLFCREGFKKAFPKSTNLLFVFDQFEKFFTMLEDDTIKQGDTEIWFRDKFVAEVSADVKMRIVFVIREDYYFQMKFLGDYSLRPDKVLFLTGFEATKGSIVNTKMMDQLTAVTQNPYQSEQIIEALKEKNELILPIKYQLVGLAHEIKAVQIGYHYVNIETVIGSLFRKIVSCSPSSDLSLKVLYAFSEARNYGIELSILEMAGLLREDIVTVEECFEYLVQLELLKRIRYNHKYELVHDYLADKLHEISGQELDPSDRDTIGYFVEALANGKLRQNIPTRKDLIPVTAIASIYTAIVLIFRIFASTINRFFDETVFDLSLSSTSLLDFNYIPICLSHFLLYFYAIRLFNNLFRPTDQNSIIDISTSYFVLIGGLCGVTFAAFYPHYWVLAIALGALFLGIKFLIMMRSGQNLANVARRKLQEQGLRTLLNASILAVFGIAIVLFVQLGRDLGTFKSYYTAIVVSFSLMLIYFWYIITQQHASTTALSRFLGLIERQTI